MLRLLRRESQVPSLFLTQRQESGVDRVLSVVASAADDVPSPSRSRDGSSFAACGPASKPRGPRRLARRKDRGRPRSAASRSP